MNSIKNIAIIFTLLFLCNSVRTKAQSRNDSDLVQFTGFVVNYDSTKTIPFATIKIKGSRRGTYSDMQGYFSFVAKRSDIIIFTCIGFETLFFTLPNNVKGSKFKSVIAMVEDTFRMEEIVIIGRPTAEQMDYLFSRTKLPEDDYILAQNNLRRKPLKEMADQLENDGADNARWKFNDYANKAYYGGQAQPIPVLDVMAWSKFIQALQNGDLKRK